jgi:hypothetical protein
MHTYRVNLYNWMLRFLHCVTFTMAPRLHLNVMNMFMKIAGTSESLGSDSWLIAYVFWTMHLVTDEYMATSQVMDHWTH